MLTSAGKDARVPGRELLRRFQDNKSDGENEAEARAMGLKDHGTGAEAASNDAVTDGAGTGDISRRRLLAGAGAAGVIGGVATLIPAVSADVAQADGGDDGLVSVKTYGAVGDDATDDTDAIQDALDASMEGAYIPYGTYRVSGLSLTGKRLAGSGTLKLDDGTNGPILTLGDGASIETLSLDGNKANQSAGHSLIDISGKNCRVSRLEITGALQRGIRIMQDAINARIEGNHLTGNGASGVSSNTGIEVRGSYATVVGNTIDDHYTTGHAIRVGRFTSDTDQYTDNVLIAGNNISNVNGTGGGAVGIICELDARYVTIVSNVVSAYEQAMKANNSSHITISNNLIENCGDIATVLNFVNATHVIFTNNIVRDCAAGPFMGAHVVCSHNILENLGGTGPVIRVLGPQAIIADNILDSCQSPYAQIQIGPSSGIGDGYTISGNLIEDPSGPTTHYGIMGERCERVNVVNNQILGALTTGIRFISTADKYVVEGNQIPSATTPIDVTSTGTTRRIANNTLPMLPSVVASSTLNHLGHTVVQVTGSSTINSIAALAPGTVLTVLFTGSPTVTDGSNLKLASSFEASADDVLRLICDGTDWYEVCRSSN